MIEVIVMRMWFHEIHWTILYIVFMRYTFVLYLCLYLLCTRNDIGWDPWDGENKEKAGENKGGMKRIRVDHL